MTPEQMSSSPRERRTGRAPTDRNRTRYYDGRLHALLIDRLSHLPGLVDGGRISVATLAARIGRCRYTCYKWLHADQVSTAGARELIRLSATPEAPDGRLTKEDLAPFLLG